MGMLTAVLFSLLTASSLAQTPAEQSLKDALLNHTVVVRGYYTGSILQFDGSGKLVSTASPGFGVDDASIYVTDFRLTPEKLTIEGQRTYQAYDGKSKQFQLALAADEVELQIALPTDKPSSAAVPELLKQVLLTDAEMQNNCTPEEVASFRELVQGKEPHKEKRHAPDAQGVASLPATCFPTGEKAYRIGAGVKPPQPIKTPDPEYPIADEPTKRQGTTRMFLILDQEGRPTTFYIAQSAGQHLDQAAIKAVEKWRFQPTLFQGTPIPVAIHVEVNFQQR